MNIFPASNFKPAHQIASPRNYEKAGIGRAISDSLVPHAEIMLLSSEQHSAERRVLELGRIKTGSVHRRHIRYEMN